MCVLLKRGIVSKGDLFLSSLYNSMNQQSGISNNAAAKHKRKLLIYLHYAGIYYVNHHIYKRGGGDGGGKMFSHEIFPHFLWEKRERKKFTSVADIDVGVSVKETRLFRLSLHDEGVLCCLCLS